MGHLVIAFVLGVFVGAFLGGVGMALAAAAKISDLRILIDTLRESDRQLTALLGDFKKEI